MRTAWSVDSAQPGDLAVLAVILDITDGFHVNADKRQIVPLEKITLLPTEVTVVDADKGLRFEVPIYPEAKPLTVPFIAGTVMSFAGKTVIHLPVSLAGTLSPGTRASVVLEVACQPCSDQYCLLPQKIRLDADLPVVAPGTAVKKINQELFAGYRPEAAAGSDKVAFGLFGWTFSVDGSSWGGMLLLLLVAAFGGMLLNFTPCVLPLIPIKIISLSYAAKDRRQCILLGLSMSLGVLVFWLALGSMISLVTGFSATNQLFQYPVFTISVGVIIAIMAGGMFDFFSLRLPEFVYLIHPEQDTLKGSFGLGILAAVLSTPCTAPFMGAAAAWAATQPPAATLTVFAAIGLGMAFPYFILSVSPHLVSRMPKAGPASMLIKQVMGLFMLAAAAYFIGVGLEVLLSSSAEPPGKQYWWPVMLLSLSAGGWMAWRTLQIVSSRKVRTVFTAIGITIMAISVVGAVRLTRTGPIDWVYYTPERLEQAAAEGKIVVMVFTAEWCLNCKFLERGILDSQKIVELMEKENVVPMKVDITGNNPEGKEKLREVGSLTIPLLVVLSPDGKQVYKSAFYTADQIYKAVSETLNKNTNIGEERIDVALQHHPGSSAE
ncbi:MAG: protein-disulfide reductase DsbD family protein [Candidatus Electrothrix sp. YB6]